MRRAVWLLLLPLLAGCPAGPPPPAPPAPSAAAPQTEPSADGDAVGIMAQAKDPVCGMTVALDRAAATVVWQEMTYAFCSKHCAESFQKEPEKFTQAAAPAGDEK